MKNKLEKFLAIISSIFLMVAIVLGIKIKDDGKKLDNLESELKGYNNSVADILETQKKVMVGREEALNKVVNSAAPDTTKAVTTQTVVPGRVVQQQVPVTSSKKTKTS